MDKQAIEYIRRAAELLTLGLQISTTAAEVLAKFRTNAATEPTDADLAKLSAEREAALDRLRAIANG